MDSSTLVAIILGVINIVGGFIIIPLKSQIANLQKEISEFKLHVAEKYVTKDEMKDHLDRIEKSLDEIKDLVKGK